jgi:hypothetical protein
VSTERPQTQAECTKAELETWAASIQGSYELDQGLTYRVVRDNRAYPPCLGCGGPVFAEPDGALIVDTTKKTVTFRPCGHVLTVPDMPDGWLND